MKYISPNDNSKYKSKMDTLNQQITTIRFHRPLFSDKKISQRIDWNQIRPKAKSRKIYISKYQCNLNGNLSHFMSSKTQTIYNNKLKFEHKYKSGRVIIPSLNTEVDKYVHHKRQFSTSEGPSSRSKCDMNTLFDKTPLTYKVKGKKRVSNSVDKKYECEKEHGIFSEDFLLCKNTEPFIGMMHKRQSSLHKNDESITDNQVNCKTITNYGMKRIYPISYKSSFVHL